MTARWRSPLVLGHTISRIFTQKMSQQLGHTRTRAQESSNAIERVYITMRHLFNRGFYKPMGISGTALREALLTLRPEIYGSIAEEKIELQGMVYIMDRLPYGIEQ